MEVDHKARLLSRTVVFVCILISCLIVAIISESEAPERPSMTSSSLLTPHFPPLRPDTLYSFYPYPTIARHRTNHSLLNPRSPYAARPGTDPAADLVPLSNEPGQSDAEALLYHLNDTSARNTTASPLPTPVGPGPWPAQATVEAKAQQKMVLERAQRRALHLQSPCGVGMDINEDRLAYAELNLVDDQVSLHPTRVNGAVTG